VGLFRVGIPDNPVFSVYQMDMIYYGYNLTSYLENEFRFTLSESFEELEEPNATLCSGSGMRKITVEL
jgi:hypothetical protein